MYNKAQQDKVIAKHKMELDDAEQVKVELEKEYYEALSDLEELRGDNTELNAMIENQINSEIKKLEKEFEEI